MRTDTEQEKQNVVVNKPSQKHGPWTIGQKRGRRGVINFNQRRGIHGGEREHDGNKQ